MSDRVCDQCGAAFTPRRSNQKRCGPECAKAANLAHLRLRVAGTDAGAEDAVKALKRLGYTVAAPA